MIAVDFFCGAGGLTRGLLNVGISVVAGIDANEGCRRTYENNNRPSKFIHADLRHVNRNTLKEYIGDVLSEELLFTGCAPCQPFSKQRRKISRTGSNLLRHFGRVVAEWRPGFVIIENVPGIACVKGNSTYRRFLCMISSLGYEYVAGRLDAKSFGVAQGRVRWVVIACRRTKPTMPAFTHGKGLMQYATVRQAISHYPRLSAGSENTEIPNHRAATIEEINMQRLMATPRDGGGRMEWPDKLILACHRGKYKGHSDVYGRMRWDAPAPTLTCRCYSISNGRYGHPDQHRAISLREAASLQSFPDDYVFYGVSQKDIAAQIGNAVPVKMGEALGRKILELRKQFLREQVRK